MLGFFFEVLANLGPGMCVFVVVFFQIVKKKE